MDTRIARLMVWLKHAIPQLKPLWLYIWRKTLHHENQRYLRQQR